MIYTVTFNPALDYVVGLQKPLNVGDINRTSYESVAAGGKGINVSWVLNALGVKSVALGFIAGFTGQEIARGVRAQGIDTDFIELDGMSRINVKVKGGDGSEETEINGQGPVITPESFNLLLTKLVALEDGDILILAGSIPNTLPDNAYERIMERIQEEKKNIRIVVDATKDLLKNVLKYHPFLVKPNNVELGELFGVALKSSDEKGIIHYVKELQKLGARNVLVSLAGEGSIFVHESGHAFRMGVAKGVVKSSVGAGDSMVAGFLAGLSGCTAVNVEQYAKALRLGTAAGSATAFSVGLATKDLIDTLLADLPAPTAIQTSSL